MARIRLTAPRGHDNQLSPYITNIDTHEMDVVIEESYLGMVFVSDSGETLAVSMRDTGFEVKYSTLVLGDETVHVDFKGGEVRRMDPL